jgi:hypothetical protein
MPRLRIGVNFTSPALKNNAFAEIARSAGCPHTERGREGANHASPNAGRPEAAFAGALAVKLNGPNYYGGILQSSIGVPELAGRPVHPVFSTHPAFPLKINARSASVT